MATTLKELAIRYLREKIHTGEVMPGAKLSELALAKDMGISRTPLREAINQLCSEGILESIPHAGVSVRVPALKEIRDLYELREVLEGYAAGKAAAQNNQALASCLQNFCNSMHNILLATEKRKDNMLTREETQEIRQNDMDFHMSIISAAENGRMKAIICDSRILSRVFELMEPNMTKAILDKTYDYHKSVADAIASGSVTIAKNKITQHIRKSCDELLSRYRIWHEQKHDSIPEALRKYVDRER